MFGSFQVRICLGNSAMQSAPEVAQVLVELAERLRQSGDVRDFDGLPLRDLNGSRVGAVSVEEDSDE